MNYLERLLTRALAVPRRDRESVFDPFEQVGAWPVTEPGRSVARTEPERAVTAPLPAMPAPDQVQATAREPAAAAPSVPPARQPDPQMEAPARAATVPVGKADIAAPSAGPAAPPPAPSVQIRTPLETADSFIRAIAPTLASLPPQTSEAPPAPAAEEIASAAAITPAAPPVPAPPLAARAERKTRSIAPPTPSVVPRIAAVAPRPPQAAPRQARKRAHAPPDPIAPGPPARPAPPVPSLRATERSLAVDRPPALRKELAHSVGILRFGLGQS